MTEATKRDRKKARWHANASGTVAYVSSNELFERQSIQKKIVSLNEAELVSKSQKNGKNK